MANISQRLKELIQQLKDFEAEGRDAGGTLGWLTDLLNRFDTENTQLLPSIRAVSNAVDRFSKSLVNLGYSKSHIIGIRDELYRLAEAHGKFADIQGRLGALGRQYADVTDPTQLIRRSAAEDAVRRRAQLEIAGRREGLTGTSSEVVRQMQRRVQLADVFQRKLIEQELELRKIQKVDEVIAQIEEKRVRQAQAVREGFTGRYEELSRRLGGEGGRRFTADDLGREFIPKQQIITQYGQAIPGGEVGIANLEQKLKNLEITEAKVTGATKELSTGMVRLTLETDDVRDATGNLIQIGGRATVTMDRFGNVMRDTSNRFRTFGSAVGNNLVKVVQWGVATGFVYGALRQLHEVMDNIITIESELAEVQIALGKGAGDLNEIFEASAEIADLTSSSIDGIIEGYNLAYQAAGSLEEPTLRFAVANNLLQESMVLAKLSGIEQAKALDILVGALKQTGQELDQGRDLLDKWVAVARESNVSLDTLAQTYAIVGAQAQNLGITFEQLNALAASLAEATSLSATETGNAIRGILAGFQTERAEKVLDTFGIEVRQANGDLRNFWELLNEITDLISAGALSPAQISEIANALGGGYRRGAQVEVILTTMARSQQLVNEQMNAGGEAADALEISMATLQSNIVRLGNAFTQLSQTLGEEGGFISAANFAVDILEIFVKLLDSLVGGLGKATPALLTFGAAWFAMQSAQGQQFLNRPAPDFLGRSAYGLQPFLARRMQGQYAPGQYTYGQALGGIRGGLQRRLGGIDPLHLGLLATIGGVEAWQARKTPEEERPEKVAEIGARIVGGIVGSFIAGTAGLIIGQSIGGAFANAVIDKDRDIGGRLAEIFLAEIKEGQPEDAPVDETDEERQRRLNLLISEQSTIWTDMITKLIQARQFVTTEGGGIFRGPEEPVAFEDIVITAFYQRAGMEVPQQLQESLANTVDQWVIARVSERLPESAVEAFKAIVPEIRQGVLERAAEGGEIVTILGQRIEEGIPEIEREAESIVDAFYQEAERQFTLGEIDISEFLVVRDLRIERLAPDISRLRETLKLSGEDLGIERLTDLYLNATDAERELLNAAAQKVQSQSISLDAMIDEGQERDKILDKQRYLNALKQDEVRLTEIIAEREAARRVQERPIVELGLLTDRQIEEVRRRAEQIQFAEILFQAEGDEEAARAFIDQIGDTVIATGEGAGREFWGKFIDIAPEYIKQALEDLDYAELVEGLSTQLRDLRDQLGVGDYPALMQRYERVRSAITSAFPGYEVQEESIGLILKDGFREIHADQTLLNLAMQDLIDVNEQQLEGVWNIPAGMTAFVAWSSLFTRNVPTGGGQFDVFGMPVEEGGAAGGGGVAGARNRIVEINEALRNLNQFLQEYMTREGALPSEQLITSVATQIEQLEAEREEILTKLAQQQIGQQLGLVQGAETAEMDTLEALREALTIQNKIELNANIRLTIDGRTIANVVKQYLFEDLQDASNRSFGSGGGSYIIEGE